MRLQILGDIHLEFAPFEVPVVGDVVVLAGDIGLGIQGLRWAAETFVDVPVVYVAGNHEFYGHRFPDLLATLRGVAADAGIVFLENNEAYIGNVRFLGATLWTNFLLRGQAYKDMCVLEAKDAMSDFQGRITQNPGVPLHPVETIRAHKQTISWLGNRLSFRHDGPTVVVTHHAPSIKCSHPRHRGDDWLSPAFVSDLEKFIGVHQPDLWISGHTHFCADFTIGATRVVSNQRGYAGSEFIEGFNPGLVLNI